LRESGTEKGREEIVEGMGLLLEDRQAGKGQLGVPLPHVTGT
jgi:hypothetical protein